ncbi:MAG: class I poly(R)-hydroxyalkanoic acid synthase, partial [Pseudomonadota bacterium]|nr:class I poly(R)-hydroxyalkanoic acid synthase [Pseudomonadota bacterium]
WPDWVTWAEQYGGGQVAARMPGEGKLPLIEPAPGAYVRNKPAPPTPRKRPRRQAARKRGAPRSNPPTPSRMA